MNTLRRRLLAAPLAVLVLAACQTPGAAGRGEATAELAVVEQPQPIALAHDAAATTVPEQDALAAGAGLAAVGMFGVVASLLPIILSPNPTDLPPGMVAPSLLTAMVAGGVMVAGVGLVPFLDATRDDDDGHD